MATSDRREYLTATVLDQDLLDRMQDNLEMKLELVVDVETPAGTIKASDRNKYVAGTFYEALTEFPVVKRSIGEWLEPVIEFSRLTVSVSNVDGRFNQFIAGGANFGGWIGKRVDVKLGLRDVSATYTKIYSGLVTDVGGFQRDRTKITLITRDDFDRVNRNFPSSVFTKGSFPDLEDNFVGVVTPVVYGDWTVGLPERNVAGAIAVAASVPVTPVNGANAGVVAGTTALRCIVSANDNVYLDTANVYLKRSDIYYPFDAGDITIVSTGNRIIDIKQVGSGGTTLIDGAAYQYTSGDLIYVRCKGKDLGAYDDNLVEQAKDILMTYGGVTGGEIDANWASFRDKASPAESSISTFKSRVWVQEPQPAMQYVLSMLEQVRLEAFLSRELKFKLSSLHFDDFEASPTHVVRNWDVEEGTFNPMLDDRNVWNRARAAYAFDPSRNENAYETAIFRNSPAITQSGKEISKKVVFPNLYEESTVILQLKEMLKLASGYAEFIEITLTPRAVLRDIGDFVSINVNMGSVVFENVPAMIREISYDPRGLKIPVKLWSMQMIPFPGYSPGYAGIVGGSTATITQET
jgi:hypothetical protein